MVAFTGIVTILSSLFTLLVAIFIKSPEQKLAEAVQAQKEFDEKLRAAMERAKNEKNPTDLSRLINGGDK